MNYITTATSRHKWTACELSFQTFPFVLILSCFPLCFLLSLSKDIRSAFPTGVEVLLPRLSLSVKEGALPPYATFGPYPQVFCLSSQLPTPCLIILSLSGGKRDIIPQAIFLSFCHGVTSRWRPTSLPSCHLSTSKTRRVRLVFQ